MRIEQATGDQLAADAGVSAIVSTRVYQLILPQSPVYPAVRVQLLLETPKYRLDGVADVIEAHLQVDAFDQEASGDDPYATASTLADAIDAVLSGFKGPLGVGSPVPTVDGCFRTNRIPTYDPDELRVVRICQTYQAWYRAA